MDFETKIPSIPAPVAPQDRMDTGEEESANSNAQYLRALRLANEGSSGAGTQATSGSPPIPDKQNSYASAERRKSIRHKCEGSVEFRTEGSDVHTWATVTDISQSGCYVEMQVTSPPDTPVDMLIEVQGIRLQAKGMVRVSYPFLGMGIAFTEITDLDRAHLDDLLLRLAGGGRLCRAEPNPVKPESAAPDLSKVKDAGAALNAVGLFFQTNRALTREEFVELIFQSQNDGRLATPLNSS